MFISKIKENKKVLYKVVENPLMIIVLYLFDIHF